MIEAVVAAGKTPIVPKIPWGCTAAIQNNVPGLNQEIDGLYAAYPQVVRGPDLWTYFNSNRSRMSSDCVHPTGQGYAALREQWANAAVANVYGRVSGSSTPTPTPTATPSPTPTPAPSLPLPTLPPLL